METSLHPTAAPEEVPSSAVPQPRKGQIPARLRSLASIGKGVVGLLAFGVVWDVLRLVGIIPERWAPSAEHILVLFFQQLFGGQLLTPTLETLLAWALGLLVGSILGAIWGALMGASQVIGALSSVAVAFLRPLPAVAMVPIAILLLGIGQNMVLAVAAFAVTWPVLFNTYYGVREVPGQYLETGKALGKSPFSIFTQIVLVAAAPAIATGIRVAAGVSLVVVIATQMIVGSNGGLGAYALTARTSGQTDLMYVAVLTGGILGVLINLLFQLAQRWLFRWSPENRGSDD